MAIWFCYCYQEGYTIVSMYALRSISILRASLLFYTTETLIVFIHFSVCTLKLAQIIHYTAIFEAKFLNLLTWRMHKKIQLQLVPWNCNFHDIQASFIAKTVAVPWFLWTCNCDFQCSLPASHKQSQWGSQQKVRSHSCSYCFLANLWLFCLSDYSNGTVQHYGKKDMVNLKFNVHSGHTRLHYLSLKGWPTVYYKSLLGSEGTAGYYNSLLNVV